MSVSDQELIEEEVPDRAAAVEWLLTAIRHSGVERVNTPMTLHMGAGGRALSLVGLSPEEVGAAMSRLGWDR